MASCSLLGCRESALPQRVRGRLRDFAPVIAALGKLQAAEAVMTEAKDRATSQAVVDSSDWAACEARAEWRRFCVLFVGSSLFDYVYIRRLTNVI